MAKRGEEEEDCDQVEEGGRESEEETYVGEIGPCDRRGWGKRAVLQTQWMLQRMKEWRGEGCRDDQKRRKPDRNARTNASCYGLPDRDAYLTRE